MNIVEQEANDFFKIKLFKRGRISDLASFKETIEIKLYDFTRDRDKLDFLKVLYNLTKNSIEDYLKAHNKESTFVKERNIAIFAIEQEIDSINTDYLLEVPSNDKFSVEEESTLHSKLNDIIKKLEDQFLAQQVIFEEIESLKDHFNLGKKTWFQLLKGKLIDMTFGGILDKTISSNIFDTLNDGFDNIPNLIE